MSGGCASGNDTQYKFSTHYLSVRFIGHIHIYNTTQIEQMFEK